MKRTAIQGAAVVGLLAGAGLIVAGLTMAYVPLGLIAGGAFLVWASLIADDGSAS